MPAPSFREAPAPPEGAGEGGPRRREPEGSVTDTLPKAPTLGGIPVGSHAVRRGLLFSFADGMLSNGMLALNETFAIAAAINLGASSMAIALLSSLPLLLGSVAQFLTQSFASPSKGRKHYVLLAVRLQATLLFLCGFTGFLPAAAAPWAYAACFVAAAVSASATNPFWVDWMGDLVPEAGRGRHFAWRAVSFAWVYLACALTAGTLARHYTSHNAPWTFFLCVFGAASALRFGAYACLRRQYEPREPREPEGKHAGPMGLLKFRPPRHFVSYCLATSAFSGAAAMSGPFFNVWFLRDLHFDYLTLAITLSCTVMGSITFVGFWGKLADNFGTSKVLWISGLMVSFIPALFLFSEAHAAIWCFNFFSGAAWAGYNLANFNHLLGAGGSRQRVHFIAFASLVSGLCGCAFTLLGGYLATRLPPLAGYGLRSLFLLSFVLRLSICLACFRKFREYREGLPRRSGDVIREFPGIRVSLGLYRNATRVFQNP